MDKYKYIIPLNDMPIPDNTSDNPDSNSTEDISEKMVSSGSKIQLNNIDPNSMSNAKEMSKFRWNAEREIDFAWGFLLFDMPEIYHDGNKIYFSGEIHRESINALKRKIIEVGNEISQINYKYGQEIPILLYIHSPGGGVSAGFNLIDFIENYPIPIYTIGTGIVASMGFMILLSGKKRFLTPYAHILIHELRTMLAGKRSEILDYIKHIETLHKQFIKYIRERTALSRDTIEQLLSKESWLDAEEALKMGIIDGIWKENK